MAHISYDTDNSANCICDVKRWPQTNALAGFILYTYGNRPHIQSVCPDIQEQAAKLAANMVRDQLESIAAADGSGDLRYCAAKINDVLKQVNDRIRKISELVGLGIYLGGTVTYMTGASYITFPFGGGVTYLWNEHELLSKGGIPADGILRNALGASAGWQGECWKGVLQPGLKLFCMSEPLKDTVTTIHIISGDIAPDAHSDTVAMLLRRELERTSIPPCAVIEISN